MAAIYLKPTAACEQPTISIRDIAKVECLDAELKKNVESIDLDKWDPQGKPVEIKKRQIEIRLALAGLGERTRVLGSDSVRVAPSPEAVKKIEKEKLRSRQETLSRLLLDKLKPGLAQTFGVEESDVNVEVLSRVPSLGPENEVVAISILTEFKYLIGRKSVQFAVKTAEGKNYHRHVLINCSIGRTVLVTKRRIESGETLGQDNVRAEKKFFSNSSILQHASLEDVGKASGRPLLAGTAIRMNDLKRTAAGGAIIIKRNDIVRVVAQKGNDRVSLAGGIALDAGKRDDVIRIRNPKSKKIITAKIISATEVRALY